MFEREIKFIYDFNLNKLKKLGSYFTLEQVRNSDIHPAILQYISAEIEYLIFEDRQQLLKNSAFDYSGEKIGEYFNFIAEEIMRTKRLSLEYVSKLVLHSVSFTVNFLVRPRWALLKFLFEEDKPKSSAEVKQILKYLYYYDYLKKILVSYLNQKKLLSISYSELEELLNKIDGLGKESYQTSIIQSALGSMAEYLNIGSMNKNLIPIEAVTIFLTEKGYEKQLALVQNTFGKSEKQKFDVEEILRVVESVESSSEFIGAALNEEFMQIRRNPDEIDLFDQEVIEDEPDFESDNPAYKLSEEKAAELNAALEQLEQTEEEIPADDKEYVNEEIEEEDSVELPEDLEEEEINLTEPLSEEVEKELVEEEQSEFENTGLQIESEPADEEEISLEEETGEMTEEVSLEDETPIETEFEEETPIENEFEEEITSSELEEIAETDETEDYTKSVIDDFVVDDNTMFGVEEEIETPEENAEVNVLDELIEPAEEPEESGLEEELQIESNEELEPDEFESVSESELEEEVETEPEVESEPELETEKELNHSDEFAETEVITESEIEEDLENTLTLDDFVAEESDETESAKKEMRDTFDETAEFEPIADESSESITDDSQPDSEEEETEDAEEESAFSDDDDRVYASSESRIEIADILEHKNMTKIIDVIFDYDMEDFASAIEQISECPNKEEAFKICDTIFSRNDISGSSKEAESFKAIISEYFES